MLELMYCGGNSIFKEDEKEYSKIISMLRNTVKGIMWFKIKLT